MSKVTWYYALAAKKAKRIADELLGTVRENWERLATGQGLSRSAIEYMRPAFGVCYTE